MGPRLRGGFGWVRGGFGGGGRDAGVLVLVSVWFLSLVCWSLSWGRHSLPGPGCAFLVGWRDYELVTSMRQWESPRVGGFRRAGRGSPDLGTCPAVVAPDTFPSLPSRVEDVERETRPSRGTPPRCVTRPLRPRPVALPRRHRAAYAPPAQPSWGFDLRWSTKSLSRPRPSRGGVLGRSRQPNGSLSLTALCDRTAASPDQVYKDSR